MARRSEPAVTGDELKRMVRGGLGGSVRDGDTRHPLHSAMVTACGNFLNARRGVLVWATATGRFTGKGCFGTPGVADLAGWLEQPILPTGPLLAALIVLVECKVADDDLTPAQKEFGRRATAAGAIYFLVRWDGEDPTKAADDLKRQWKDYQ